MISVAERVLRSLLPAIRSTCVYAPSSSRRRRPRQLTLHTSTFDALSSPSSICAVFQPHIPTWWMTGTLRASATCGAQGEKTPVYCVRAVNPAVSESP